MKLSKKILRELIDEVIDETQSCDNKLAGESNAQWRARCGPRPLGAISRGGPVSEASLKRFKVFVSGEKKPLILLGKNEKDVKQTAYAMIKNSSVKIRKVVKEEKLTEATDSYVVWSPLLNKVYDGPVSEKKALMLIKKYAKQGQYHVGMLGTKYFNKTKLGKKNPVKEGKLNESWDSPQAYSSKEAQKVVDGAIRDYAKDLRKVQYRVVKDWMSKAKSGVIDYFDIVRGLQTGDVTKAHPYEVEFLNKVLNKDKIIDRFRQYFGGKKGKRERRK